MLERLEMSGLTLDLEASSTRLTDPSDFASLFPSTGGALYGRASHGWAASFLPPVQPDADPWALLRGREHPSGRGRADGRLVGEDGSASAAVGPHFDTVVPPQGYRWWYIDALSDDGRYGLTIIGFIGSVFSPYYKKSRARRSRSTIAPQHRAVRHGRALGDDRARGGRYRGRNAIASTSARARCAGTGPPDHRHRGARYPRSAFRGDGGSRGGSSCTPRCSISAASSSTRRAAITGRRSPRARGSR